MEEVVGFGLARSRLTAIPRFANVTLPQPQKRSSLSSLAQPTKNGFFPHRYKEKDRFINM